MMNKTPGASHLSGVTANQASNPVTQPTEQFMSTAQTTTTTGPSPPVAASEQRGALIDELLAAGRELGAVTVLFHNAIAARMGLSATDHKYLELLVQEGPMTAGRLAERTQLTTGAVTGMIDRLERHGLVRRVRDPHDRRKVIVEPNLEAAQRMIAPHFAPLTAEIEAIHEQYSDAELRVIRDYLRQYIEFFRKHTQNMEQQDPNT
jgi:DNA-binding MarR family transcriptional regulator